MSLSLLNQIDAAYTAYFSAAPQSELNEDAEWADFAMTQFIALFSGENSAD